MEFRRVLFRSMVFTDLEDRIIAANDAFCAMMGRTRSELIGFDSKPFTYPDDVGITEASHERFLHDEIRQVRYIKRYLHKDGRMIVAEVSKSPARDKTGKTLYFIISERDITEERMLTAQLSHQALHDPLTGLANRALLDDRLAQAHSRILRQGGNGALLLLDLDDFKGVNDTYGHLVGDQLLSAVAHRLEGVARDTDTLCRFGGDEFLYLAEGVGGTDEAQLIAQRFLRSLDEPFLIGGLSLEQRASLGVVVWDAHDAAVSDVVRDADVALYEAKRLGKGRHFLYVSGMHHNVVNRFSLVQELRQAVAANELAMHYQPILRLSTNEVVGFEALMRWHHSERGWVPPGVFIPFAEQSDLILDLGAFALHESIGADDAPLRNRFGRHAHLRRAHRAGAHEGIVRHHGDRARVLVHVAHVGHIDVGNRYVRNIDLANVDFAHLIGGAIDFMRSQREPGHANAAADRDRQTGARSAHERHQRGSVYRPRHHRSEEHTS